MLTRKNITQKVLSTYFIHNGKCRGFGVRTPKGKLSWQNQMDYGRRARVENTMHRYKSIIGNKLRSKTFENQNTEVQIAVWILNRMAQLGMPKAQKAA
jgi:hypothetical protein